MRSISRVVDVSINTVSKILFEAGEACASYHYDTVRGLKSKRVQCDEIGSFCYSKEANVETAKAAPAEAGNVWTWTALDADSKLIVSYMVGDRDAETAAFFMDDLRERVDGRMQLTTDGLKVYLDAVQGAFHDRAVDYGMLVKMYGDLGAAGPERKYSPDPCIGAHKRQVAGNPDKRHISTSHVERMNLNMRMGMRRFTRLTNAFSKKIDNHIHALSLYFVFYNFCRIHKSLRVTPAMAAGISDNVRDMEWIVALIDARAKKAEPAEDLQEADRGGSGRLTRWNFSRYQFHCFRRLAV